MQIDNLKLENIEMQFSLKAVEVKKYTLTGDSHNRNPYADCIPRKYDTELPESRVVTKMVPCTPCTWG